MLKSTSTGKSRSLPKFWRPRLTHEQVINAQIVHHDLLETMVSGSASGVVLFDWMETCATYLQMMRLLEKDGTEFTDEAKLTILQALDDTASVAERFRRTKRVGFSGPELMHAREAASVMDELIAMDRNGIAEQAALWSVEQRRHINETIKESFC